MKSARKSLSLPTLLTPGIALCGCGTTIALFREQQGRLTALSTNDTQTVIPNTGHNLPGENPAVVIDAIREMAATP